MPCTFTITVLDTQPPFATCPANINRPAVAPTAVNYSAATAGDNCPGVVLVGNPPSGSVFQLGQTIVTQTATDASNNTATCSFAVNLNTASISGTIFNDRNRNGVADAGEAGLASVGLLLDSGVDGNVDAITFTDVTGHFAFFGLAPATYRLRQALPAGMLQTTAPSADMTLTVGQQVAVGSIGDYAFPVRADFDGDFKSDVAVYRPSSGTWFWLRSTTSYASQGMAQ